MILQILGANGPLVLDATRVLVLADDGVTPLAAAVDHPGGGVEVQQAASPDGRANPGFRRMLAEQGLDRSLVLARAPLKPLAGMKFSG